MLITAYSLKFFILALCLHLASTVHFCFLKHPAPDANLVHNIQQFEQPPIKGGQFRSYHPHYLISLSYPQPMTPHIYYGEVIGNVPLFFYADVDRWHPNSIQKLVINGVEFTDASAKYFLLRREEQFRYMLVIQVQNSYQKEIAYTMNVYERKDHFLVVCQYANETNAFVVYLTNNDEIIQLKSQALAGVKINVRNQSNGSGKENWRLSRRMRWLGRDNYQKQGTAFTGFILEIQYSDRNKVNQIKLNVKQAKYDLNLPVTQFVLEQSAFFYKTRPQKIRRISKYGTCADAAYQRLLDGLSYEYGTLSIRDGFKYIKNKPKQLLSFSPSRKKFPWGFLWDDGFHCQVAVRKEPDLVLRVIKSWLDTMLESGWIPRQQNRGQQRQDLCNCPRFMAKDIKDGNPPTLILALSYLYKQRLLTKQSFPVEYFQKLTRWYEWFMNTQTDGQTLIFRWHDSLNQKGASFTSGLDDFPRPEVSKGHIDLQVWMYFFTKFMAEVSHVFDEDNQKYINNLQLIKNNFKYFINPRDNTYRDIAKDSSFSLHFGYLSILPIAFGVPEYGSPEYNATIAKIKEQLDIGQGLASISRKSPLYLSNRDAYWRGPVWVNLNYLFLRGLKLYYPQQQALYLKLREQLLVVVCGTWQKTGYFYENYINGQGSFGYPFNGWTSLVALLYDESY